MLVTLLLAAGLGQGLGQVPKLPVPISLRIEASERWVIQSVPVSPRPNIETTKPRKVRIGGRTVTISPTAEFEHVEEIRKGQDGSLLIDRAHRGMNWSSGASIWFEGKETPVRHGDVEVYSDRLNYAGSIVRDRAPNGMPLSCPEGYVVEKGRWRSLGFGTVNFWGSYGTFVLTVPVDAQGKAAGTDTAETEWVRVIEQGRATVFPGFRFVARQSDGATVLATEGGVLRFRDGKVLDYYRLPERWRIVGVSPRGWILLRRGPKRRGAPMPNLPTDPKQMEAWSKSMSAWTEADSTTRMEAGRDWTAGVMVNGTLIPLQFVRPKAAEELHWDEEQTLVGNDTFRFEASLGNDFRAYRVAAPPNSRIRGR